MLDRNYFRREEPIEVENGREISVMLQQKERKHVKHKIFLKLLFAHRQEFLTFHKKKQKKIKKYIKLAKNSIEDKDKRKQNKYDRIKKQRLKALRD